MLYFSTTLKTKEILKGESIHLTGRNNWLQVKMVSIITLILFLVFMILGSTLLELLPFWFFVLLVMLMLFLVLTSVWNLYYYRQSDSLLRYLIFDRKGIHLNHKINKESERVLLTKEIKRIRIVLKETNDFSPTLKMYLNYRRAPFLEFKFKNEKQLSQRAVLDLFMHCTGLLFFQKYQLTRGKTLYEYTTEKELKLKERFSRKNFSRNESEGELIFKSASFQKHFIKLNLKNQTLSSKTNLLNTYKVKFSEVANLDSSIGFHKRKGSHSFDDWMICNINLTNSKNNRSNILSSKAPMESSNDILEFESLKEMDEIIEEIKKVIGLS